MFGYIHRCHTKSCLSISARLEARGSNSRIHITSPTDGTITAYDLFGAGDSSLGRLFYNRKFDTGMVAFLSLIQELGQNMNAKDSSAHLPYVYYISLSLGVYIDGVSDRD